MYPTVSMATCTAGPEEGVLQQVGGGESGRGALHREGRRRHGDATGWGDICEGGEVFGALR